MKILKPLLLLLLTIYSINSYSQEIFSVPVTSHVENQIVQGPCYTFAMVAAIESMALQKDSNVPIDLSEFNLYAQYIWKTGGRGGIGAIENSLEYIKNYGALNQDENYVPLADLSNCANTNSQWKDCMIQFEDENMWEPGRGYFVSKEGGEDGMKAVNTDNDIYYYTNTQSNTPTIILKEVDDKSLYNIISFDQSHTAAQKAEEMKRVMKGEDGTGIKKGIIALFDEAALCPTMDCDTERERIEHGVFIYGFNDVSGSTLWSFKDSWPYEGGLYNNIPEGSVGDSRYIDLNRLDGFAYITGDIQIDYNKFNCGSIGDLNIKNSSCSQVDLRLENLVGTVGPISNITWNTSDNLNVITGQSGQDIFDVRVVPVSADFSGYEKVTVSYQDNSGCNVVNSIQFWIGKPKVNINPSTSITAYVGDVITLSGVINGAGNSDLTWVGSRNSLGAFDLHPNISLGQVDVECFREGDYYINAYGTNECGLGIMSSVVFKILPATTEGSGGGPGPLMTMNSNSVQKPNKRSKELNNSDQTQILNNSIKVYPSPAKEFFNIEFEQQFNGNVIIQLINALNGQSKEVLNSNINVGKHQLKVDSSRLSKGFYIVRIGTQNGIQTRRIYIQ